MSIAFLMDPVEALQHHTRTLEDDSPRGRQRLGHVVPDIRSIQNNSHRQVISDHNLFQANAPPPPIVQLVRIVSKNGPPVLYADRRRLGGVEYKAVRLLAYLIPTCFLVWRLLGCLSSALYIVYHCEKITCKNAINPWWLGMFLGVSAFTSYGLSLLKAIMAPFGIDTYLLITLSLLIMAGNIAYPLVLRWSLWLLFRILSKGKDRQNWYETIQFIPDYPGRVYTNIFPAAHTWWLLFILVLLTGTDWISFSALNLNNLAINSISFPFRESVKFFQSLSIRSAGFSIVSISVLAVGTKVISVVIMYILAYPVLIPLRSSNVYDEQSLGLYKANLRTSATDTEEGTNGALRRLGLHTKIFFIWQQIQHQLTYDMWLLTVSTNFIVYFESDNYGLDSATFLVINIDFEVVSAYGPVGLSTELPNQAYSLSGGFHIISKVLMCAVMIKGRHRGLPVCIDKAVLLSAELSNSEGTASLSQITSLSL